MFCSSCQKDTSTQIELTDVGKTEQKCGNCGAIRQQMTQQEAPRQKSSEQHPHRGTMSRLDELQAERDELQKHVDNVSVYRARIKVLNKALRILEKL